MAEQAVIKLAGRFAQRYRPDWCVSQFNGNSRKYVSGVSSEKGESDVLTGVICLISDASIYLHTTLNGRNA